MEYETIILEKGPVATICINRPDKRNAMNQKCFDEMQMAIAEADRDERIKVVILKGSGRGFCAGADLESMTDSEATLLEKREYTRGLVNVMQAMAKSRKLIIAQVHGFAVAGGFGLAMAADMVICAKDAKLGMPEIKNGILPMNIMAPVSRAMPKNKFMEMMFTGAYINGEEAASWGIVNRAVEEEALEETVRQTANEIAVYDAVYIRLGKEAYYTVRDMEYFKSFSYLNNMLMMTLGVGQGKETETENEEESRI